MGIDLFILNGRKIDDGFSLRNLLLRSDQGQQARQRRSNMLILGNRAGTPERGIERLGLYALARRGSFPGAIHTGQGDRDQLLFRGARSAVAAGLFGFRRRVDGFG